MLYRQRLLLGRRHQQRHDGCFLFCWMITAAVSVVVISSLLSLSSSTHRHPSVVNAFAVSTHQVHQQLRQQQHVQPSRNNRWLLTSSSSVVVAVVASAATSTTSTTDHFSTSKHDKKWLVNYQLLEEYRREHGHCDVPIKHQRLGSWVQEQRAAYKKNRLKPIREKMLNDIDFRWSSDNVRGRNNESWLEQYERLKLYHKEHGHCNVPRNWPEHRLGHWIKTQRYYYSKGWMRPDRKQLLDDISIEWFKTYVKRWHERYEDLILHKENYGNFLFDHRSSLNNSDNDILARWVKKQRANYVQNKLSQERIDKLNEIQFTWSESDERWMLQYEKLVSYQKQYGHCCLTTPPNASEDEKSSLKKLRRWAQTQRYWNRQNRISPNRKKLLNDMDFPWDGYECNRYRVRTKAKTKITTSTK